MFWIWNDLFQFRLFRELSIPIRFRISHRAWMEPTLRSRSISENSYTSKQFLNSNHLSPKCGSGRNFGPSGSGSSILRFYVTLKAILEMWDIPLQQLENPQGAPSHPRGIYSIPPTPPPEIRGKIAHREKDLQTPKDNFWVWDRSMLYKKKPDFGYYENS